MNEYAFRYCSDGIFPYISEPFPFLFQEGGHDSSI